MSQAQQWISTSGTLSGTALVNDYNAAIDAIATMNSGATAPPAANQLSGSLSAGNSWYNTSTGAVSVYDGAQWLTIGYLDTTNHIWNPIVGGGNNGGTAVASAATTNLVGASGAAPQSAYLTISGTTTITSFGSNGTVGQIKIVTFSGILTLTYNSTSLILPGAANITTAAGDVAILIYLGSGNWRCISYTKANGQSVASGSGGGAVVQPGGRLTLTANTPEMSAAVTATATLYYVSDQSGFVPYYTGTVDATDAITGNQVSTVLSSSYVNSNDVFDVFWVHGTGICLATNGSGGGWSADSGSVTARGSTYTVLDYATRAYVTNKNAISNLVNGTTTVSAAANKATWLGTVATDPSGVTLTFNPQPSSAGGGAAAWVGVWNAYNRRPIQAISRNSSTMTIASASYAALPTSGNNRITIVKGAPDFATKASASAPGDTTNSSYAFGLGVALNSAASTPFVAGSGLLHNNATYVSISVGPAPVGAVLGLNYVQLVGASGAGGVTASFYAGASGAQAQGLMVDTTY